MTQHELQKKRQGNQMNGEQGCVKPTHRLARIAVDLDVFVRNGKARKFRKPNHKNGSHYSHKRNANHKEQRSPIGVLNNARLQDCVVHSTQKYEKLQARIYYNFVGSPLWQKA